VLFVAVALLSTGAAATSGTFPGKNGLIVFASTSSGGRGQILTANATGGKVRRIALLRYGGRPAWSPDGRLVAFSRVDPSGESMIYLVRPDGTGIRRLSEGDDPAWSPDGKRIVTTAGDADTFVRMIDVALGSGSDIESLTDEGIGYYTYAQPAWSPRGTQIAFGTDTGIALYDVTTGEARNIERLNDGNIAARGAPAHPNWSPGGKRLTFDTGSCCELQKSSAVYVARNDGTHVRRLARNASRPAWSPDGRKIVFVRLLTRSNSELFVMNVDGTHQRRLTFRAGLDLDPDWQALPR
jgi:Tol biopolymer transport system component